VQASPACANLVFETVHPLIQYYTDKIPAASLGSSTTLDSLFMGLKFFGFSERVIKALKGLMEDSVAVMVCFLFLFMPSRLANIGVIIIALLLPAYKSSNCVFASRELAVDMARRRLLPPNTPSTAAAKKLSSLTPKMWLQYWTCLGFLWLLRFHDIRLWASSMMVFCLWLQNANFHGASVVLTRIVNFVDALLCYKRKDEEPAALLTGATTASAAKAESIVSTPKRVEASAAKPRVSPVGMTRRISLEHDGEQEQEQEEGTHARKSAEGKEEQEEEEEEDFSRSRRKKLK
jgi:hypothetical protein